MVDVIDCETKTTVEIDLHTVLWNTTLVRELDLFALKTKSPSIRSIVIAVCVGPEFKPFGVSPSPFRFNQHILYHLDDLGCGFANTEIDSIV